MHFSSPCNLWLNLHMSTLFSNAWKIGFGKYDFLIFEINDSRLPIFFLFNSTTKQINIWSIWACMCTIRRKPNFTFWKILNSMSMLRYPNTIWFLFSYWVLFNQRYKNWVRLPCQWVIMWWSIVMVRIESLWIFGVVK